MKPLDRFYRWCGFGMARAAPPQVKGAAHVGTRVAFPLTLADRLRVLASGKIVVDIAHSVDVAPKFWYSNAAIAVLPPNYEMAP